MINEPLCNQEALMTFNRQAKFILAFSNPTHISSYTHLTRAYLTWRWMDALRAEL
jgi:hypothetical protein